MTNPGDRGRKFLRVLVVDDEASLQLLLSSILELDEYMVDVARDGLEACQKVQNTWYDAIVCDVRLPHMDGAEFYATLAASNSRQASRVMFVTGYDLDPLTKEALDRTGRPLLRKPFTLEEIQRAVTEVAHMP